VPNAAHNAAHLGRGPSRRRGRGEHLDEGLVEADERVLELELRERLGRADLELRAVLERRAQRHRRRGEKHLHVVLLLQPLLDHLEAEGGRRKDGYRRGVDNVGARRGVRR